MCTAIRFNDRLFGRTFDFERSFGEEIVVTPRGGMRIGEAENRYAIMGVGIKNGGTPLYFDGINEWGLSAAALNFPGFAVYHQPDRGKVGLPSAHLISTLLGFCRSVAEAKGMLKNITITPDSASLGQGATPLHWMASDQREAIVIESVAEGLRVQENKVGVLTNSPGFSYHLTRLDDYSSLSVRNSEAQSQSAYSRGTGAIGLPGDYSSTSRFVRAAFLCKNCSVDPDGGMDSIGLAFDILGSVSIPRGAVITEEELPAFTRYTAVMDMENTAYYLTTASCRTVGRIRLTDSLAEACGIISTPFYLKEKILDL